MPTFKPPNLLARQGVDAPSPSDPKNVEDRLHGFLLTWNGAWESGLEDVKKIQQLKGPEPYLVAEVQESQFYQRLWAEFVAFMHDRVKDHGWPQLSCKMELSLHRAKVANVVHFHVAVTDPEKVHRFGSLRPWIFKGATPFVRGAKGRGRHLVRALNNAHYYTQAPKLGSVFTDTNWARFTDFPVEASSVMSLWRLYKMTHETAKIELWRGRVRGVRGSFNISSRRGQGRKFLRGHASKSPGTDSARKGGRGVGEGRASAT